MNFMLFIHNFACKNVNACNCIEIKELSQIKFFGFKL